MVDAIEEFFEYLSRRSISPRDLETTVYDWSSEETLDFIREGDALLSQLDEPSSSRFSFSATTSLSGGPFPCYGIGCRLDKLDSLARFATLYGDKVYVANPFEKYLDYDVVTDHLKYTLLGDLAGLLYAKPLYATGLFGIRNNLVCVCEDCLRKITVIENELDMRLAGAEKELLKAYASAVRIELDYLDNEPFLKITGPEHLIEHGQLDSVAEIPTKLLTKYSKSSDKRLSKSDIEKYGYLDFFVSKIMQDLFQLNLHSSHYQTHYLSDREVDIQAVATIDNLSTQIASRTLLEGLAHSIPTVLETPLEKLLQLRYEEGEAFEVYRDNITKVLKEANGLSAREGRELIDDTVRPVIHEIENKLRSRRKLLVGSLKRDLVVNMGYVGIGIFGGFISKNVTDVLAAVGGLNFLKDTVTALHQLRTTPEAVLENPYYFLWKLKKTETRI